MRHAHPFAPDPAPVRPGRRGLRLAAAALAAASGLWAGWHLGASDPTAVLGPEAVSALAVALAAATVPFALFARRVLGDARTYPTAAAAALCAYLATAPGALVALAAHPFLADATAAAAPTPGG